MATTIEQQTALDESLVPSTQRLRIGRSNFRLPSDIQSKEATLQVVYDPWRSFTSVINKCLTGKSSGVDSFRLSQAQMLWGFYHRINIDFAYLIWEDFLYQVEHKSQKKINEINYPRFTKVIIDYFMTRKPSISRQNGIHWHYVRDDALFSTIKVVSRHQTTQQYGTILPIELTTAEIRNSKAFKEYHACAIGEKYSDDEDVGYHEEGKESDESDDDRDEGKEKDKNFDSIPRTPEESEEESNDEEEQELRLSEEARIQ
nr:hypothetical protein [Tanacetum cinerariifolium]